MCVTGSNPFSIDKDNEDFRRSFRKLYKATSRGNQKKLVDQLEKILQGLVDQPRPTNSRQEPVPKKLSLPPFHEFRKIEFAIDKGAAGQIRLMYLVDVDRQMITSLWIYSHEQFSGRPADGDISKVMNEVLD